MEREIEGLVLEGVEDVQSQPGLTPESIEPSALAISPAPSVGPSSGTATPQTGGSTPLAEIAIPAESSVVSKSAPRLSPMQRRIIASLNTLPQLRKERVWIPDVRNSHATIIARDVANYPFHALGQGVLRHWADSFIL